MTWNLIIIEWICDTRAHIFSCALKPCSYLTSEVPVEVMQTSHLQFKFIPHGFLQGFPLWGGLCKVFIGFWHQLDFSFQLRKVKGKDRKKIILRLNGLNHILAHMLNIFAKWHCHLLIGRGSAVWLFNASQASIQLETRFGLLLGRTLTHTAQKLNLSLVVTGLLLLVRRQRPPAAAFHFSGGWHKCFLMLTLCPLGGGVLSCVYGYVSMWICVSALLCNSKNTHFSLLRVTQSESFLWKGLPYVAWWLSLGRHPSLVVVSYSLLLAYPPVGERASS